MKRLMLITGAFTCLSLGAKRHNRPPLAPAIVYQQLQCKIDLGQLTEDFFQEHNCIGFFLDKPFASGVYKGFTPLTLAIELHRPVAVDLLLAYGADANAADAFGNLPLALALQRSWFEGFRALLNADAHLTDDICLELPRRSIVMDYVLCYSTLTQHNLNVMLLGNEKYYNIVRLVCRGADVNYKNKYGATAIDNAVRRCDARAIKILHKYGARLKDIQQESIKYVLSEQCCTRCCFSDKGERHSRQAYTALVKLGVLPKEDCDNSCCRNVLPIPFPPLLCC